MSVVAGVEHDLKALPKELRESALAQGALALARVMDDFETDPTQMASCFRALQAGLEQLRELAPPDEESDGLDDIAAQRAKRLERSARAANKPRP